MGEVTVKSGLAQGALLWMGRGNAEIEMPPPVCLKSDQSLTLSDWNLSQEGDRSHWQKVKLVTMLCCKRWGRGQGRGALASQGNEEGKKKEGGYAHVLYSNKKVAFKFSFLIIIIVLLRRVSILMKWPVFGGKGYFHLLDAYWKSTSMLPFRLPLT